MPKVLLTGGGTAGHVTPNLALLPYLKEAGFEVEYVGTYDGIEKRLVEDAGVPYHGISSGKLRRYVSGKNVSDLARIQKGMHQARKLLKEMKPDVVFSKGGFVTVPVVAAAREKKIPVVIHESDLTPGLANRLSIPSASVICYNFPETADYFQKGKAAGKLVHTGLPLRDELFEGSREKGLEECEFDESKPVLLVIGGSLGAANVNHAVWLALPGLLERFQIIHICGKGKMDESKKFPGYLQFEYVSDELKDFLAASDIIISRAGANTIWEIAGLKKPALLIPLGSKASRGDQILNAQSFEKLGYCDVIFESELNGESLLSAVDSLWKTKEEKISAMEKADARSAARKVADIIISQVK